MAKTKTISVSPAATPGATGKVDIAGLVVNTEGMGLAEVPLAIIKDKHPVGVFWSDPAGNFKIKADGTQALLSRILEGPLTTYLHQGDTVAIDLKSGTSNPLPPGSYRGISGFDCVTGPKRRIKVMCCGKPVPNYPVFGFMKGKGKALAMSAMDGVALFPDEIDQVKLLPQFKDRSGVLFTYRGNDLDASRDHEIDVESSDTKTFVEGLVVNECGEPIPHVCVLLLDAGKVLLSGGKTETDARGRFRFDLPGEYAVFGAEHRDAASNCCLHLVSDPIVRASTAAHCGQRLVPTAIYGGCCSKAKPPVIVLEDPVKDPLPPPDPGKLDGFFARWQRLHRATTLMREGILKSEKLTDTDRTEVLSRLDQALGTINLQMEATRIQQAASGITDGAFIRGSMHSLLKVESSLRSVAARAKEFVSRGEGEVISAGQVLEVFQTELAALAQGENR